MSRCNRYRKYVGGVEERCELKRRREVQGIKVEYGGRKGTSRRFDEVERTRGSPKKKKKMKNEKRER